MPKLVPITAKNLIKILGRLGFVLVRTKGSHHFFFNPKTRRVTSVPVHAGEQIGIGLLKQILREIKLEAEDYDRLRLGKK